MGTRRHPLRFVCRSCGAERETWNYGNKGIYCNKACRADFERKGREEPRRYEQGGYWMLEWRNPDGSRGFQFEHRAIWEQHHGPIPDGYVIHHINEDKQDNRIKNLHLMSRADHTRHHWLGVKRKVA